MSVNVDQRIASFCRYLDKHPTVAWLVPALWILVVGGLTVFWQLGSTGLVDETEPLFAEAARQMTVTGDWVTPYFNGDTRFDKPPLIYWLMAIAYQMIGVNEWAARLPSALSAIALMGMGFYVLRRFGSPNLPSGAPSNQLWLSAFIGSALIVLHPLTIVWARTGVSDMLLTGCIGLALMSFFCGYVTGQESLVGGQEKTRKFPMLPSPWYLACYIFLALAILTKGPVGIVLPGLIVGAFLLYVGNLKAVLREMRLLWGLLFISLLAVPWYVLVTLANGETFIDSFFGYHNIDRFTSVVNHHQAPWYFYSVVVLGGFAPWSVFLPQAIAQLKFWKRSLWRHQPRSAQLGLFALIWFAGVFGFFTIAVTKLPSYVLPLMPAAAILVAIFWSQQMTEPVKPLWGIRLSSSLNALLFLIAASFMIVSPRLLKGDKTMPDLALLLQASGLPILGGAIAIATATAILVLVIRRQIRWIWLANLIGGVALIVFTLMPAAEIVDSQRQLPLRQLSEAVIQNRHPGEELVMLGTKKPSVVFYTQEPVTFIRRSSSALDYLRQEAVQQPKSETVLILGSKDGTEDLGLRPNQYQIVEKLTYYQLIRVSKSVFSQMPHQN